LGVQKNSVIGEATARIILNFEPYNGRPLGPILDPSCITRPRVWPRATLLKTRLLMVQRAHHLNTAPQNKLAAQALIARIDAELQRRDDARSSY